MYDEPAISESHSIPTIKTTPNKKPDSAELHSVPTIQTHYK